MASTNREAAARRLDVARGKEEAAANKLDAADGVAAEFHAGMELRAAEGEVAARSAWLAWADEGANGDAQEETGRHGDR